MPEQIRAKHYDVFVSYKREDDAARDVLIAALQKEGFDPWWDAKLGQGDFRHQLRDEINRCDVVIALWSQNAHARPDEVKMEMAHAFGVEKLLPLKLDNAPIPAQFAKENFLPFDGWADEKRAAQQLAHILAEARKLGAKPKAGAAPPIPPSIPVEFGDIPGAPDKLIGRDTELEMLHGAWESRAPKKVNAVVLHALGGAGKSALLRTFANELLAAGGAGASRIYGWSAYSQGSGEQKRADADSFISKALGDFGWQGELPRDPVERARALAKLIQKERVLLLLDGLEPLQDAPSIDKKGRFKDKGLAELVKMLANQNAGLMVLTTRQEVPELEGRGSLVINHPLEDLSDHAGADLLVELGVHGRQRDLEAAVHELQGHALSVTLLGTYLAEVCGGGILHRDQFDFAHIVLSPEEQSELLTDKTIVPAKRAAKVMRGYLAQFDKLAKDGASDGPGGPELALLNLLGLFDRPADGPAVDALLAQHIPGLTDDLFFERLEKTSGWLFKSHKIELEPLSETKRAARLREAKSRLRKLRLLSKANPKDPHELDAHPVVRAFFAGRLEEAAPEAAKAAHGILYRHYAAAAPDLPDTLDEMQPLFHAVQHGVKAGRAQEALDEVFRRRIRREDNAYILRVLGAFGPYITTQAHFFEALWRTPCRELKPDDQAWLLGSAAFALTALGRLSDSVEPRRAALEQFIQSKRWGEAAINGSELTTTLLTLGRAGEAVDVAGQAVTHADRSRDEGEREARRLSLAAALTAAGDFGRAAALFAEAEEIQGKLDPDHAKLYALQGYQSGELILARGDAAQALERGRYQLGIAERYFGQGPGPAEIGFGHLLIGRAQDALGDAEAASSLDAAVAGLRKSGRANRIPQALLARAAHRRRRAASGEMDLVDGIRADLAEVEDIAGEEMRLYLTDLALERARLALDVPAALAGAQAARAEAEAQTAKAAALIADTGYHRRDGELAELQARLKPA